MFQTFVRTLGAAVLFLLMTVTVRAAVVYDLTLPANGDFDQIQVEITVPTYLIGGGLIVLSLDDPEVTDFDSGATPLTQGFIGLSTGPMRTFFGVALGDVTNLYLLNEDYPEDFFFFNRAPDENGTFPSVRGTLTAFPPFSLDDATPTAQLTVSGEPIPEPASILTFSAGAGILLLLRRLRSA